MSVKTLRQVVTEFSYDATEKIAAETEIYGDSTTFCGYPAYEDNSNMVKGSILGSVINLAIYRYKNGDSRYLHDIERINSFSGMFESSPTATWGKRMLLSGLCKLYDAGLYSRLSEKALKIYTYASDYSDFLDKETLAFKKNLPTNYYHVAMACALYREKLGMENEGMSTVLLEKLISLMDAYSSGGWPDEAPGYGRFDSYSVDGAGEMIVPLLDCGKEIPEKLMSLMKKSVDLCLLLMNTGGNGFMYGRSLAYHGDCTPLSVLTNGFKMGLIPEDKTEDVKRYIINIVKKITEFWQDDRVGAVNLWLYGRATNCYRNITRILEVTNGARGALMNVLSAAEQFGFDNYPVEYTKVGYTDNWECSEIIFDKTADSMRSLYILRRCGIVFGLPFINGAKSHVYASYLTFPASAGFIEAPPETQLDFLVPKFTLKDGSEVSPKGFFDKTYCEKTQNGYTIYASGKMTDSKNAERDVYPEKTDIAFTAIFRFCNDKIEVTYTAKDCDVDSVYMMYCGKANLCGIGFDSEKVFDATDKKYDMWHGNAGKGIEFSGKADTVGYVIRLA